MMMMVICPSAHARMCKSHDDDDDADTNIYINKHYFMKEMCAFLFAIRTKGAIDNFQSSRKTLRRCHIARLLGKVDRFERGGRW